MDADKIRDLIAAEIEAEDPIPDTPVEEFSPMPPKALREVYILLNKMHAVYDCLVEDVPPLELLQEKLEWIHGYIDESFDIFRYTSFQENWEDDIDPNDPNPRPKPSYLD